MAMDATKALQILFHSSPELPRLRPLNESFPPGIGDGLPDQVVAFTRLQKVRDRSGDRCKRHSLVNRDVFRAGVNFAVNFPALSVSVALDRAVFGTVM